MMKSKALVLTGKFPTEIILCILKYVTLHFRSSINIIKSNLPYQRFNIVDLYDYSRKKKINWDLFSIGDCVITAPSASWGFRERKMYIRSYCFNCTDVINDNIDYNYVRYIQIHYSKVKPHFMDKYISPPFCKQCRNYAFCSTGGYKICINCYEKYKYKINDKHLCFRCETNNYELNRIDYHRYLFLLKDYLNCNECMKTIPKFCNKHIVDRLLDKYKEALSNCGYCKWDIKNNYNKCGRHKYWFM